MKLFTKYNRINIAATILIFLLSSTAFYFTLNFVLLDLVDDDLRIEQREITTYVKRYDRLPENIEVKDQVIRYAPATSNGNKKSFSIVRLSGPHHGELEKYRQLNFGVQAGGQWYGVTVSKSLEDTEDLVRAVLIISLSTILLILAASAVINRYVLKKLWRPFYRSLETVKDFRISKDEKIAFQPTEIDEFQIMNGTLQNLMEQAQADYLALKTFSENAAHEIQTPVAIVQSKLDLLLQEEGLTQKQSENLANAYNAVQRLTMLNQHLLLLAKIENRQFDSSDRFNLTNEVEAKLADFAELWNAEDIHVDANLSAAVVKMNGDLAHILLNNLLSNATRHNYPGGRLAVLLNSHQLQVMNTSKEPALDQGRIFQRFYKPAQSGGSNGLGLSIIKQICDASGFDIAYAFRQNQHVFTVSFSNKKTPL